MSRGIINFKQLWGCAFLYFLFLFSGSASAASTANPLDLPVIDLSGGREEYFIGDSSLVIQQAGDKTEDRGAQSAITRRLNGGMIPWELRKGLELADWYGFSLRNVSNAPKDWVIELGNPTIEDSYLFFVNRGKLVTQRQELIVERKFASNHNFRVTVPKSGHLDILVAVKFFGKRATNISVVSPQKFVTSRINKERFHAVVLGFMVCLILINGALLFATRDVNFSYLTAFIFCEIWVILVFSRFGVAYLSGGEGGFWSKSDSLAFTFLLIAVQKFVFSYLDVEKLVFPTRSVFRVTEFIGWSIIAGKIIFFSRDFSHFGQTFFALVMVLLGVTIYQAWRMNVTGWRYCLLASLTGGTFAAGYVLSVNSSSGSYFMRANGIELSLVCSTLVLTIAMCHRIYDLRMSWLLELQKRNEVLEARVSERTEEISAQQSKVFHAVKLATLGQLAAGLSHEINNPLAIIHGRITQIIRLLPKDIQADDESRALNIAQIHEYAHQVHKATTRIARITRALRNFAGFGVNGVRTKITVDNLIASVTFLCDGRIKDAGVELIESIPRNLPPLKCAPNEITEALLTIFVNAIEAVVRDCPPSNRQIRVEVQSGSGEIQIAISDNGNGIPPDIEHRIFDPFFTTKEFGSGSGLGLSSARGLVEKHGGSIKLSRTGNITSFLVSLPLSGQKAESELSDSKVAA